MSDNNFPAVTFTSHEESAFNPADILSLEKQDNETVRIEPKGGCDAKIIRKADFTELADKLVEAYGGVTRRWKVYGAEGHRQRESFFPSICYNFSTREEPRIIQELNSDLTGTNEYTEVAITCSNAALCEAELDGQITDGIFENSRVGKIVEIV